MARFSDQTLDVKKLDGGINDSVTADLIDDDQWSYARNVYGSAGAIITRNGYKRLTINSLSASTRPVKALGQIQASTNNYNFGVWNHQLFKLDGSTVANVSAVRLKNNYNTTGGIGYPMFGFFNFTAVKNAVICNGIQTPVRWDGTSAGVVNISGSAPATSDQFINYDNYGLLYDFDSLKVYRSNLNDANAGYGANTPYVVPTKERGDIGSGMCQFGDELIVTTRRSVHKFTKTGVSTTPFTRREIASHVGNVAPRGMVMMDNGILFVDYSGIYFYDGALLTLASKDIPGTWDDVNKEYVSGITAVNYKAKNWVVFAVPYGQGQATNNLFLVYDYLESTPANGNFVWYMFDNATAQSMGIFRNSSLVDEWWTGDNSGRIFKQDTGTNDNGSAFNQYAYGKKPNVDKRLHQSRYVADASGNWNLGIEFDIDLTNAPTGSTSISLYEAGTLWGVFTWGVGLWASQGTVQRRKKFQSTLRGRFIQHRFKITTLDQFFRLYRYFPSVSYKNLRGRDMYS
jgi:hypothetical protein